MFIRDTEQSNATTNPDTKPFSLNARSILFCWLLFFRTSTELLCANVCESECVWEPYIYVCGISGSDLKEKMCEWEKWKWERANVKEQLRGRERERDWEQKTKQMNERAQNLPFYAFDTKNLLCSCYCCCWCCCCCVYCVSWVLAHVSARFWHIFQFGFPQCFTFVTEKHLCKTSSTYTYTHNLIHWRIRFRSVWRTKTFNVGQLTQYRDSLIYTTRSTGKFPILPCYFFCRKKHTQYVLSILWFALVSFRV